MANIKSQIKRIKTNAKAQERNKSVRSSLKTAIRRFRDAVTAGDATVVTKELRAASRALDVAVAKGVIHKNQAATRHNLRTPIQQSFVTSRSLRILIMANQRLLIACSVLPG